MAVIKPKVVFVSSTCHDLPDLRAELKSYLEPLGFVVKLSEDYDSAFKVSLTEDSIQSCLNNVIESDVVVCIADRRYGPLLPGAFALTQKLGRRVSATEAEVLTAREAKRPIITFIRGYTESDYHQLRVGKESEVKWVQAEGEDRPAFVSFLKNIQTLPANGGWSNWFGTFRNVVDLKPLILRRLIDEFPEVSGTKATDPERMVRVSGRITAVGTSAIIAHFKNYGVGTALMLQFCVETDEKKHEFPHDCVDGIFETETIDKKLLIPQNMTKGALVCTYQNRFGDVYRIKMNFDRSQGTAGYPSLSVHIRDDEWLDI